MPEGIDDVELSKIIVELNNIPVGGRIAEVHRLIAFYLPGEEQLRQVRLGLRGWLAGERLLSYMATMDQLDFTRVELGKQVREHQANEIALYSSDLIDSLRARLLAIQTSGKQEVIFHYFCLSVSRVERLLITMAKCVSLELPKDLMEILSPYRAGRDYYEHYEDRIPGGARYEAPKHENETADGVSFSFGLEPQGNDRLLLGETVLDVSTSGLQIVRNAVHALWEMIGTAATNLLVDFVTRQNRLLFGHMDVGSGPHFELDH